MSRSAGGSIGRPALILAAINAALWVGGSETSIVFRSLGSALLWVSAYPTLRYLARPRSEVPFVPAYCAVYFVAYGLPAFFAATPVAARVPPPDAITEALVLALAGECLFLVVYAAMPRELLRLVPSSGLGLRPGFNRRLLVAAVLFSSLAVAKHVVSFPVALAEPLRVLGQLGWLSVLALGLAWSRGQLVAASKLVVGVTAVVMLLVELGTGSIANPIRLVCAGLFVFAYEKRRLPVGPVLAAALLFAPFLVTKAAFRERAWTGASLGLVERTGLFLSITYDALAKGELQTGSASETIRDRASHLSTLAYVMEATPTIVPYWGGGSYGTLVWSLVPRVLYPDKPVKTLGQEFGHRYQFLGAEDATTSYNFEQLVEMYANFGWLGAMVGMAALGALYRMLRKWLGGGDGGALVGALVWTGLLSLECDFSVVHGTVVQTVVVCALFLRVLRAGRNFGPNRFVAGQVVSG